MKSLSKAYEGFTIDSIRDLISKSKNLTRSSALEKRFDMLAEIQRSMKMMESVFGFQMDELRDEILQTEDTICDLISELNTLE